MISILDYNWIKVKLNEFIERTLIGEGSSYLTSNKHHGFSTSANPMKYYLRFYQKAFDVLLSLLNGIFFHFALICIGKLYVLLWVLIVPFVLQIWF